MAGPAWLFRSMPKADTGEGSGRDARSPRAHRVAGGGCPPPAPTERSVQISRTALFDSGFTALQEPATPRMGGGALVSVTAPVLWAG
jgi:hypothetical protein